MHGSFTASEEPGAIERRLFRLMCVAVALAVLLSAVLMPWRVTTGLLLGGLLSLLNHQWLRAAVATAFANTEGVRPKVRIARYILRYFIIGAAIAFAHWLDVVSLVAALAGLCSFAVALLAEGFMQTFFAIVHREEN